MLLHWCFQFLGLVVLAPWIPLLFLQVTAVRDATGTIDRCKLHDPGHQYQDDLNEGRARLDSQSKTATPLDYTNQPQDRKSNVALDSAAQASQSRCLFQQMSIMNAEPIAIYDRRVCDASGSARVEEPSKSGRSLLGILDRTSQRQPRHMHLFPRSLGLRHKSTIDWSMRMKAWSRVPWEQHWTSLESGQAGETGKQAERVGDIGLEEQTRERPYENTTGSLIFDKQDTRGSNNVSMSEPAGETSSFKETLVASAPGEGSDSGYFFFSQLLDHMANSSAQSSAPPLSGNSTFRQYYHVSNEFYKPGGPIILWIPGESPLQTVFSRRGLAYELANATSGLLVALEHRFYGSSIPRFQDSPAARRENTFREKSPQDVAKNSEDEAGGQSEGRTGVWGANSFVPSNPRANNNTTTKARIKAPAKSNDQRAGSRTNGTIGEESSDNSEEHRDDGKHSIKNDDSTEEGLPLDLLQYLSVDQSIEDIASFIAQFPRLQPSYFSSTSDNPRWILAGCSYGGNLAAWTRQRYRSKIFAAFASSAPIRSALDFYEYSTSQSTILGDRCSRHLARARDFLDSALQTTDDFMRQMSLLDSRMRGSEAARGPMKAQTVVKNAQMPFTPGHMGAGDDKEARQAAKLRILTWFSPDFARDYASEGEQVHAAGWVWWTVASAVQYNGLVTPPGVEPAKTAIDILCETMEQAHSAKTGIDFAGAGAELEPAMFAMALATWFRDLQYFTPTKAEDLQHSDLDPNSSQNLASMAWLWQTCSELGYLQTSRPSTCCCPDSSALNLPAFQPIVDKLQCGGIPCRNYTTPSNNLFPRSTSSQTYRSKHLPTPQKQATDAACQPCHCSTNNSRQLGESVFSRLLTLEAAWQECQLYFGTAHSRQKDKGAQEEIVDYAQGNSMDSASATAKGIPNTSFIDSDNTSAVDYSRDSAGESPEPQLLRGYPDVERNVNNKFHGWEIVEESSSASGSECGDILFGNDLLCAKAPDEMDAAPPPEQLPSSSSTVAASSSFSSWMSSLMDPPASESGGRYYFTNGENDPWRDLTLASADALEFLKIQNNKRQKTRSKSATPLPNPHSTTLSKTMHEPLSSNSPSSTISLAFASLVSPSRFTRPVTPHITAHPTASPVATKKRTGGTSKTGTIALPFRHRHPHDRLRSGAKHHRLKEKGQVQHHQYRTENVPIYRAVLVGDGGDDDDDDDDDDAFSVNDQEDSYVNEQYLGDHDYEAEEGDGNIVRIIPRASHCQDILYESGDLESAELREERQHVLKTFVRWIDIDVKRQQREKRKASIIQDAQLEQH
ncbi:hypothetical protein BGZ99_000198 [Dissophora globulifera]|uniref:Uncharacterized protein n=1 Tax=Dissophora globulifera TaxID=979702 RepID=A0A9P6UYL1_9FUNG|nr:hypothetical protein BGZ99_000198 [Dissophora globulifera]